MLFPSHDRRGQIVYNHDGDILRFVTNAVERMRIDGSQGRVGINTTGFADTATALNIKNGASGSEHTFFDIECNTNETCRVRFSEDGSTYPGEIRYNHSNNEMDLYVNSSPRMTINSSGNVMIATDSTQGDHNLSVRGDSLTAMVLRRNGSNGGVASFMKESNFVGSITVDGSSTTYNTSSDYRLKENIINISDGISRVKQLEPKRFNFIIRS